MIDDHFYVKTSLDRGCTWTVEKDFTNTVPDLWHQTTVDLSAYSGHETLIRFEYVFDSGAYWPSGGVWLDNIQIDDAYVVSWNLAKDGIPPGATDTTISGRLDNGYYYVLEARDAAGPLGTSPYEKVIVVLDPELDVDNDGMANGWESQYFGSPTGAVAEADADNDGFCNLGEYLAGTGPTNDQSYFTVQAVEPDPAGVAVLWPSLSNRTYSLWFSTNLLDGESLFTSVTSGIPTTPPTNRFVDENAAAFPMGFYRIGILAAP